MKEEIFKNVFDSVEDSGRFSTVSSDNGTIIAVCDEYGIEFNINDYVTFYVYERYVNVDMWGYIKDTMEWLENLIKYYGAFEKKEVEIDENTGITFR